VRAICVETGVTRSGQSELVVVPADGTLRVGSIDFFDPQPIPLGISLSAPASRLQSPGEVLQLAATASFADGSTGDVTLGAAGTTYRSSNPAIASVDADGRVTAQTSGNVLISAINEGAIAILDLEVLLSGDSDGDGLPDDWELANGLDPNNPVDALDDP